MNETDTTSVTIQPGDPAPSGDTDWGRVEAMTEEDVLAAARSDPDASPLSEDQLRRMRRVSRVRVIRERLGMSRAAFAIAYRIPEPILEAWEDHRMVPDAPARALLLAIERDPEHMRTLLAEVAA